MERTSPGHDIIANGTDEISLNYPVYFFTGGNFDYANGEIDISLSELEMVDVELSSSDDEVSLSEYDVVKIDEYRIKSQTVVASNNCNQGKQLETLNEAVAQSKQLLVCLECRALSSTFTLLQQHYRLEHPKKQCHVKCCRRKFYQQSTISQHIQLHHTYIVPKVPSADNKTISANTELDSFIQNFIPYINCTLCGEKQPTFSMLTKHFRRRHPTDEAYILCCERKWTQQYAISEHIRVHMNANSFKCIYCGKFHLTRMALDRHMLNITQRPIYTDSGDIIDPFLCKIAVGKNQTYARKSYSELDHFIANWKPRLECVLCSVSCLSFTSLEIHFVDIHPNEKCFVLCCERKFYTRNQIEEHINLHIDPLSYKCQLCDKWYSSRASLYSHMCTQHPLPLSCVDDKESDHRNEIMLKEFRKTKKPPRRATKIDELVVGCKVKVECGECSKTFPNYSLLRGHYYCVHPFKECYLTCCGLKFCNTSSILRHLDTHMKRLAASKKAEAKERKLKARNKKYDELISRWRPNVDCVLCHKNYPTFSLLKQHFLDDHPLTECYLICCQLKLSGGHLMDHVRFHNDPSAFKCNICDKLPSSKMALCDHMRHQHPEESKVFSRVTNKKFYKIRKTSKETKTSMTKNRDDHKNNANS